MTQDELDAMDEEIDDCVELEAIQTLGVHARRLLVHVRALQSDKDRLDWWTKTYAWNRSIRGDIDAAMKRAELR